MDNKNRMRIGQKQGYKTLGEWKLRTHAYEMTAEKKEKNLTVVQDKLNSFETSLLGNC